MVVTVVGGSGQPQSTTFSSDQVADTTQADVQNTSYDGGVSVSRGSSVHRLMALAGVDFDKVAFVEVDAPDPYGRHLLVGPGELDPPSTGEAVPAFYPDPAPAHRMNFVRDSRGSDDDPSQPGPNQGRLLSADGGALQIVVHTTGRELTPTATATPTDGSDRTFTLSCSACAGLTTTWYFPDGTTSSETSPTYTFASSKQAGSYLFAVAVEDPDPTVGSFGWGQTGARVGAAPAPTPSATATGSGGNGHGHHGATHAPTKSSGPGSGTGHGGSATASPTASATSRPSGVPTSLPTPQPSSSLSVPATSGPLSMPTRSTRPTPSPTPTPTVTPTATTAGGATISGVLLTDAQAVPVAPSAGADVRDDVPQPSAAAAPILDPHFTVDPLVWLGVGGALLLGAGAISENDRVRRAVTRRLRRWARIGA